MWSDRYSYVTYLGLGDQSTIMAGSTRYRRGMRCSPNQPGMTPLGHPDRIRGENVRSATTILATVLMAATFLVTQAGPVSARHLASPLPVVYSPPHPNEIPLLVDCISGVTETSYPASTGFFVLGGWFFFGWTDSTAADKRAFMSRATTTDFFLDGAQQGTSMWSRHTKTFTFLGDVFEDVKLRTIVWENHNGLSGTHVLTGEFFEDASFTGGPLGERVFVFSCDLTVHFT